MCRNFLVVCCVLLLGLISSASAIVITPDIGVFEANQDVGDPQGIGFIMRQGYSEYYGDVVDTYFQTGGGYDIWGTWDEFNFAYRNVTGDWRFSLGYEWQAAPNGWTKVGPMFRWGLTGDAVNYYVLTRRNNDRAQFQSRDSVGAGSWEQHMMRPDGVDKPYKLGIQRITWNGLTWMEGLVDWGTGAGWERIGSLRLLLGLSDEVQLGVAHTSHQSNALAQVWVYDPRYESNPSMVGPEPEFPVVPADAAVQQCPTDQKGFHIRTIKALLTDPWGWGPMDELLDTGCNSCVPGVEEGSRIDPVVNLWDSGGHGAFGDDNHYPGIDQSVIGDPADGDDDNNHATEILACIYLTAGLHIIGANSDDGTYIKIGGVEVARTEEWKGASNRDFIFEVEADGYYPLMARHLEGGGGSSIELHEVLMDGTRILLGATDEQGNFLGSPVYVPEPATVALLGLGGLALLRIRKKR